MRFPQLLEKGRIRGFRKKAGRRGVGLAASVAVTAVLVGLVAA